MEMVSFSGDSLGTRLATGSPANCEQLTECLLRSSSQELVEDVEAPLSGVLMDHTGLLQQI